MHLPDNDYQILRLTDKFYNTYSNPPFKEILEKRKRAYNCLLFQSHYEYFICIPFRSEIKHSYAFHFKKSKRSKLHKSGLDYSKIIIINNKDYLDSSTAIVDKDEYNETLQFLRKIKKEALDYVDNYVAYMNHKETIHPEEFKRRYGFSTLQYFHEILGIET